MVSLKRINSFLNNEELDDDIIERSKENKNAISVKDASFTWDKSAKTSLEK